MLERPCASTDIQWTEVPGGVPKGGGGFDSGWDIGGYLRGVRKKRVLLKQLFSSHATCTTHITVFPAHNMPLALVGIPLFGYSGC